MDYHMLTYISNGIIIENLNTNNITFINKVAKEILKINDLDIDDISVFFSNKKVMSDFKKGIIDDLKTKNNSEGIAYFKSLDGNFVEISFCCVWVNEKDNIISYIFKKATEVIGENSFSFQEVTEFLPSGIVVMDIEPELTVTYANSQHYKMLGMEMNEYDTKVSRLLKDSIYEEDRSWVLAEINDNLYQDKEVDIEFRIKDNSDDGIKWVRLHGQANESATGHKLFYSSLKDLSQRREINDKLHIERVLFYKMTELSDELLFRFDIKTNTMYLLGKKIYHFDDTIYSNAIQKILNMNIIYEEDLHIFHNMLENFKTGIIEPIELRCMTQSGMLEWHKIIYSFIENNDHEPLLVIGKLVNINEQKLLEDQAKLDALTEFYNKSTTAIETDNLIAEQPDFEHVLLIIDIDNFKAINDNLGHHHGDVVLWGVANDIRKCFRDTDILGRIGGDEFIVVMANCSDMNVMKERAEMVCENLRKTFAGENGEEYSISSSIGVAVYPYDGTTYTELYQNADIALYETKARGKDGFSQFNKDLENKNNKLVSKVVTEKRRKTDIPVNSMNHTVIESVINLLNNSDDVSISLKTVMKYLGITYKVDRCYIYETLDGGTVYQNNYQWTKEKRFSYDMQYYDEQILLDVFKKSNKDGTFWTNNIQALENEMVIKTLEEDDVKSIFLASSKKENPRKIFLGLDDCQNNRVWTEEEVRTLYYVSKMIFSALINYNSINKLSEMLKTTEV